MLAVAKWHWKHKVETYFQAGDGPAQLIAAGQSLFGVETGLICL